MKRSSIVAVLVALANSSCAAPCNTVNPDGTCSNFANSCRVDSDCAGGQYCDPTALTCVTPCNADADCEGGQYCDPGTNGCASINSSNCPNGCPAGESCQNNVCVVDDSATSVYWYGAIGLGVMKSSSAPLGQSVDLSINGVTFTLAADGEFSILGGTFEGSQNALQVQGAQPAFWVVGSMPAIKSRYGTNASVNTVESTLLNYLQSAASVGGQYCKVNTECPEPTACLYQGCQYNFECPGQVCDNGMCTNDPTMCMPMFYNSGAIKNTTKAQGFSPPDPDHAVTMFFAVVDNTGEWLKF